jgi:hypothetical protein
MRASRAPRLTVLAGDHEKLSQCGKLQANRSLATGSQSCIIISAFDPTAQQAAE